MGRVKVIILGTLGKVVGGGNIELTIKPPIEVAHVIHSLSELQGGKALIDPKSLHSEALILINGVEISNLEGVKTQVEDGDTLVIIPVTHGG
ncbi:MAG: MoaD/ThiS family protein [Candidatus Bathyarchaeia archaeon]